MNAPDFTPEQPLPRPRYLLFLFTATLLIAAFYLYVFAALILGLLVAFVVAVLAVVGAQYGGLVLLGSVGGALWEVVKILARSLRLSKGPEYRIALSREAAPHLWSHIEELARQLAIAPPREILLESGVNAWMQLSGVAAGRGKAKLGVGFDLLAGLSKAQAGAVMAHEMAHAKHVQRGYQGFLMRGWARLNQCAGSLESVKTDGSNAQTARTTASVLGAIPARLAQIIGKLVAVCSRYDEFEADRVSAHVCGANVCQSALLTTHVLDHQADKISYRERLLHLERAPGYTHWLREKLHVSDAQKRAEIEERAVSRARRHELSTHPALPDRLAALGEVQTQKEEPNNSESAIFWLANPDESAKILLREIERVAAIEEAKATAQLAKWMKKSGKESIAQRDISKLLTVVGVVAALWVWLELWGLDGVSSLDAWVARGAVAFVMALLGIFAYTTKRQAREKAFVLPVPSFADYRAASYRRRDKMRSQSENARKFLDLDDEAEAQRSARDSEKHSARRVESARQLRALLPPELANQSKKTRRLRLGFWLEQGRIALEKCDYERAASAARLALDEAARHTDALLLWGMASVSQNPDAAFKAIGEAYKVRASASTRWAIAWANSLEGHTDVAEAFLLPLSAQKNAPPLFWALLGYSQAANGKPRESLASRKTALQIALKSGDSNDEASHRFVLAQNQLALGLLGEAREHLDWLSEFCAPKSSEELRKAGLEAQPLAFEELKWQMAAGNLEKSEQIAENLAQNSEEASQTLKLADILGDSSEDSLQNRARELYRRVLETGHFPQALLALAQLDARSDDASERENARLLLLQALDCQKTRPLDATHPLNVLNDVLNDLRAIEDLPPQKVEAFETIYQAKNSALEVESLGMLCYETDLHAAHLRTIAILAALLPDLDAASAKTERATPELQPEGEAPPAIYGARWEN